MVSGIPDGGAGHRFVGGRAFAIAEPGEAHLAFWAHALEQYRGEIDRFLKAYAKNAREDSEHGARSAGGRTDGVPSERRTVAEGG